MNVESGVWHGVAVEDPRSLAFPVRYRLGEYLSFSYEHAFATQRELRELTGVRRRLAQAFLKCVAAVLFLYKSARVGQCHFRIDVESIRRRSRGGEGAVAWSQVKAVHMYSRGYLIELQRGAMPVPFRVLSAGQHEMFRSLAGERMGEMSRADTSSTPDRLRGAV